MLTAPLDLAAARILLSNDDGIAAPGLKTLERVMREICRDVWVAAPEREQSGAGHSLTLRQPLRIRRLGPKRFAVDGTPTDSVLLGIRQIVRGRPPSLLVSGINLGGNMGEDVTYSGTVSAAMEGTLLGVPSIAFSLAVAEGATPHWDTAAQVVGTVVRRLATFSWPGNTLMNVNIPNLPADRLNGIHAASQGRRAAADNTIEATDPRGRRIYWIGPNRNDDAVLPGTDLDIVRRGGTAIVPVHLDFTHRDGLEALRSAFP
jgi:5'-nucleotidase